MKNTSLARHPLLIGSLIIALLVIIDQSSKYWIVQTLAEGQEWPLLPILSLYHTRNTGIAFSMLSSFSDIGLIVLTIGITIFISYLFWQQRNESRFLSIGYLLVIGGALGNLIDRIRLNYVVDFILVHTGQWSFAVFNFADSFITIGALMIVGYELCKMKSNKKPS